MGEPLHHGEGDEMTGFARADDEHPLAGLHQFQRAALRGCVV